MAATKEMATEIEMAATKEMAMEIEMAATKEMAMEIEMAMMQSLMGKMEMEKEMEAAKARKITAESYGELQAKIFERLADEELVAMAVRIGEIGASVVFRGLVEAMESNLSKQTSIEFDRVIQLKRVNEESRRETQRALAVALKLDSSIMAKFDEYDEEDDFSGVGLKRDPIPLVAKEIYRILKDSRLLLLVCNYGGYYPLKLLDLGVPPPAAKWSDQKILWVGFAAPIPVDVSLSVQPTDAATALDCAYVEASEIANHVNKQCGKSILTPPIIFRCLWYQLVMDYFHTRSYVIQHVNFCGCEGIIEKDAVREIQNMLPLRFLTEMIREDIEKPPLIWDALISDSNPRWSRPELLPPKTIVLESSTLMFELPPHDAESYRSILIKTDSFHHWDNQQWGLFYNITSLFIGCPAGSTLATPDSFFRQFANLRVLHLFRCIISFMPHSFLGLCNLRFLRLESCELAKNNALQPPMVHSPAVVEEGEGRSLGSVLILDLLDNNFDGLTSEALELMPNLEEINIVKSTSHITLEAPQGPANLRKLQLIEAGLENVHDGFFEHTKKLEVLNLSNNIHTKYVSKSLSMATGLKELILDGCEGLEILDLSLPASLVLISLRGCSSLKNREFVLPPLPNLKTFRHSGSEITMLSLQGCSKLEDIELDYLSGLKVLDLSGTALERLPLNKMEIPKLKQLVLLGCKQLKRIDWDGLRPPLVVLYLDNCSSTREDSCLKSFQTQNKLHIGENGDNIRFFKAHIVVRDARLLRSLIVAFGRLQEVNIHIHIHISSSAASSTNNSTTRMISPSKEASLVAFDSCRYAHYYTVIKRHASNEPPSPSPPLARHIDIDGDSRFPFEIKELMRLAKSLSVHDNASIITIERPMRYLKQCRVERCRNMDTIFTPKEENDNALDCLEIMWAYNLLRLNSVCKEGINLGPESFSRLRRICLEFCPRLKFVFPSNLELSNLEAIDIRYCGDLRAVFLDQSNGDGGGRSPKLLPKLSSICYQELPRLQYICKSNICCPVLQELKFRGCWSLTKFPIFNPSDNSQAKALKISCEKDWWEKLEWDGLDVNHHHSLFNPSYSPSCKKPLKARYL